ncbi:hypothetical protein CCP3SC5AM1_1810002 [Gammaproteobacteria bacterium]
MLTFYALPNGKLWGLYDPPIGKIKVNEEGNPRIRVEINPLPIESWLLGSDSWSKNRGVFSCFTEWEYLSRSYAVEKIYLTFSIGCKK